MSNKRGTSIERIALVLFAAELTTVAKAARDNSVSKRTVLSWRSRQETDPELEGRVQELRIEYKNATLNQLARSAIERQSAFDRGYAENLIEANKLQRAAIRRARRLLKSETDLDKVTRVIEKNGANQTAADFLNAGTADHREGAATETPADTSRRAPAKATPSDDSH